MVLVELKMENEGGVFRGLRPGQGMASQVSRGGDLFETGPSERRRDSPHVLPVCCELGQCQPDLMLGCRNRGHTIAWSRHQVFMSLVVPYSHTCQPQSLWALWCSGEKVALHWVWLSRAQRRAVYNDKGTVSHCVPEPHNRFIMGPVGGPIRQGPGAIQGQA